MTKSAVAFLLLAAIAPLPARAIEVELTRHLSTHTGRSADSRATDTSFFGVPGAARLIVTGPADAAVEIRLNGEQIPGADHGGKGVVGETPVILRADNDIAVTLNAASADPLTVRVTQTADIELHVTSRIHFNANVADFDRSRSFYGKLGFETLSGFPDTNTLEMAQAIGIETPTAYDGSKGEAAGGYLLHGELIGPDGFGGGMIDLIEFSIPRTDEPPYPKLNHLGMASATMLTTNIAADYGYMTGVGVRFVSPPTARSDGTRFAVFTDPDGTHYQLVEVEGEDDETDTTHIVGLGPVNINVSDYERSRAWYRMLGYEVTRQLPATDSLPVARAMGFPEPFEIDGALLTHPIDGSTLEIVQWIHPHDPEPPYPVPVNHPGIHRMAFLTTDIEADVAALAAQGVAFVSPITPCCSGPDSWGRIIAFYDPDGTIVELVEQPVIGRLTSILLWLRNRVL